MGSTFGGLEIGKRGLSVHQQALNVTGHNIANADNENYARQRVTMKSMDPLYDPSLNRASGPGQIGQGVQVAQIERIRNTFFDDQVVDATNNKHYWEAKSSYFIQIERIFNEPSDNSLRSLTDKFWGAWQDLSSYPSEMAHREVVLERANGLTTRIQDIYGKLDELRLRANIEVTDMVDRINSIAGEIRDLNERILKLETLGDNPNDLMDTRDAAIEKLSAMVDLNIGRGDKDELIVFIGQQALIQGEIHRKLKVVGDPTNEGMNNIVWEHSDREVMLENGNLKALIEIRDRDVMERINSVDSFAINIADIVNEPHKDGFGLNGSTNKDFFSIRSLSNNTRGTVQIQNASGNYDLNQDGTTEVTSVFRVTGVNKVDASKRTGLEGTLTFFNNDESNTAVRIDYSQDESLEQIVKRINDQKAGVVAYINHDNQLALKGVLAEDDRRTNFMIRHLEDSGQLLVGYTGILNTTGEAGAFDFRRVDEISKLRSPLQDITLTPIFHPAAYIKVSNDVLRDPTSIAAGRGKDVGGTGDYNTAGGQADGENALLIASSLKQSSRMVGHSRNSEEFYNSLIAKLGTESRTAEDAVTRQKDNLLNLGNLRQSVMGVSLDEEMSNMVQFQHAYTAAARVINSMNEMIEVIIRMGA